MHIPVVFGILKFTNGKRVFALTREIVIFKVSSLKVEKIKDSVFASLISAEVYFLNVISKNKKVTRFHVNLMCQMILSHTHFFLLHYSMIYVQPKTSSS